MTKNKKQDLLAIALLIAVFFFLVTKVSNPDTAFVIVISISIFYVLITAKWHNRRRVGFWVIIGSFAVIHAFMIYYVTVPHLSAGLMIYPFALLDALVMYYVVGLYDKLTARRDDAG
ncbi:MAG: hypothetical protein ACR2KM_05610 [Gemmatimonadaceae bacterium]